MFFYILYRIGYFLANSLSLRAAYFVAERCSDIQYFLAKKDRLAVQENLGKVLGKDPSECVKMSKEVFRNFGLYLVDFFRVAKFQKQDVEKRVKIEGLEHIDNAIKQNKGIVILTAHMGNWELGGIVMGLLGYDISAVALNHKHENINNFFIKQRESKGLKVIRMSSVMKRCVSALLRKGLLAVVGDRDFTDSGIEINFFGIPTSIPRGAALLCLKTKSVMIPGFLVRVNKYNFKLIFEEPIKIDKLESYNEDDAVRAYTEKTISVLEKHIRAYPEQWLVFRRFWEKIEDATIV